MNAMGHNVPTMIGVDHRGVAAKITKLVPDYMVMGERGMADMGEMEMPLPDNTLPMMTGTGPFGPIEMGGMFTRREGARRPRARTTTRTRAGTSTRPAPSPTNGPARRSRSRARRHRAPIRRR